VLSLSFDMSRHVQCQKTRRCATSTLSLDVPQVPHGERPFARLV
jgi:hypothetical protein